MNYKEAKERAKEKYKNLTGYEFIDNKKAKIISMEHNDGSYMEFHSACFEMMENEWLVIFTEHHGVFVYHFEDIRVIKDIRDICLKSGETKTKVLFEGE